MQSVERTLQCIELLKNRKQGLGVSELSRQLEVAKSTVHRILSTLMQEGYVKQDPITGVYTLGLKFIDVGQHVLDSLDIRQVASPFLQELVDSTGETAHLVLFEQDHVAYIDKVESPKTIRMYSSIGKVAPLHCTGVGKAILAFLPEEETETLLASMNLTTYTEHTVNSVGKLKEQLKTIKQQGYSIDDEEHEKGIRCAAAPIFDHNGRPVAGISMSGPEMRLSDEKLKDYAELVVKAGKDISSFLGYHHN
ncbi:IclR family transcriptional regulator [Alteribacillus bidgolensis]|uniref:IclR family transcriptional regulator n=1 Tax=Alteribacillus bidgolensis TaxID=930129 RepID=UPI00248291DB|nr:IclR family transcriptional regulator [Alteribacillus bidgolensis]